jgi:TonB family protein
VPPSLRATTLLAAMLACAAPARAQLGQEDAPVTEGVPKFTPPKLIKRADAPYPKEALDAGLSGTVVLELDVDERGAVSNVKVKRSAGHGFDEAAALAVSQFVFSPAMNDRTPVPSHVTYAYKFVLNIVAPVKPPEKKRDETVRVKGGVYLRGTRAPVAHGKVIAVAADSARFEADVDDEGRFALRGLPPGKYHLVINGPRAKRYEVDETVGEREVLTVNYYVEPSQYARYEATVRADLNREEISRQTLTTEELVKMPGTMGDALRAVENLPGVARAPFNTGLIIVRGGKPTDSRVYMAGSEVPQLYHFGGLTSIVPTQIVERVDYFPGNFGVRYGRAIAGAIDVDLREGKRDRWHGAIETNLFDTGVLAEGPVGKGAIILAARRSYVDAILGHLPVPGLKFTDAPVYYDYQGVFDYPVAGGKLRLMAFGSDDVLKLVFAQPQDADPALTDFGTHIYFHKLQLRYTKTFGDWSLLAQIAGGYQGQGGALGRDLKFDIGVGGVDVRLEGRYTWSKRLRFLVGADVQYANASLAADVPPPTREGQVPSPISANEKQHVREVLNIGNVGLYVEASWKPSERLTITPGLRFDVYSPITHYNTVAGRRLAQSSLNPRIAARLQVARFTWLKAGVGLYSQPPQATDYDVNFGNPRLRPESAVHVAFTVEQGVAPGLMVEATGFYKHLYDLATASPFFVELDGRARPEQVASDGVGRIYGGELLVRQSLSKWFFGWISYTVMRSERRDCASCPWRLFDFDQTHVLVMAVHAYLPRGFEIGARFRYISGMPYTPAAGGYYDADTDIYTPAKAPVNTARLEAFHALDLRIDKTFLFKQWVLKVYLDITNVYDHANQEVSQPSFDYTRAAPITGLPIIPSFGIRSEF